MAISNLRLSGINSGYDTEAMIEQMLTSYQSKIDIQNKKLTKLTWQQDAYRDIISKVTNFKNKYFDILKRDSYLLSPSSFNKFKATIAGKTLGDSAKGISATTSASSVEGSYKITVNQIATATTAKGKTVVPQNFKLDLEMAAKNSTYTENEDGTRNYNFSLDFKVGDVTKTIEFSAENIALGNDGKVDMESFSKAVTENLNAELQKQFGRTGADTNDEDGIDDIYDEIDETLDDMDYIEDSDIDIKITVSVSKSSKEIVGLDVEVKVDGYKGIDFTFTCGPTWKNPTEMKLSVKAPVNMTATYSVDEDTSKAYSAKFTVKEDGSKVVSVDIGWDKKEGDIKIKMDDPDLTFKGNLKVNGSKTVLVLQSLSIQGEKLELGDITVTVDTKDKAPSMPKYTDILTLSEDDIDAVIGDIQKAALEIGEKAEELFGDIFSGGYGYDDDDYNWTDDEWGDYDWDDDESWGW